MGLDTLSADRINESTVGGDKNGPLGESNRQIETVIDTVVDIKRQDLCCCCVVACSKQLNGR